MIVDIRRLAAELGRSIESLIVLDKNNDPLNVTMPFRRRRAEWIAELWRGLDMPHGVHIRRVHYRLVLLSVTAPWADNPTYSNSRRHAHYLDAAVRDAIYLSLIDGAAIVDNKNPAPLIFLTAGTPASICLMEDDLPDLSPYRQDLNIPSPPYIPDLPELPTARLFRPTVLQPFHLEVWCEKSTVNDVLEPLAEHYGVNIVTGTGDLSATACRNVIKRAEESGRPVRILYLSDFDPGGDSMPVAVARKIECEILERGLDLDIQLRAIALTFEQCNELKLPRTPTKEGDSRAAGFEVRYGTGATEIDALEALYPGKLAEILTTEINRYRDPTLGRRVDEAARGHEADLRQLNAEIADKYRPEPEALEEELSEIRQAHDEIYEELDGEIRRLADIAAERAKPLWEDRAPPIFEQASEVCERARAELEEKMPDPDALDWPTATIGDEDPDPLFDSRRDYLEQLDRYRRHQGRTS